VQRGDKQLEKPKKVPQQPSNPATRRSNYPPIPICLFFGSTTNNNGQTQQYFIFKKNLLVLQLGQAFLPLPGQHSNLISVLRGRFSIQADTLERLQERDE
jgi:hypothetical protein